MPIRQFVVWNFFASLAYSLSVAASAYGVSELITGPVTGHDIALLVIGLAVGSLILIFARRRRALRRKI